MRTLALSMTLLALVLGASSAGAAGPQPAGEPVYATTVAALPDGVRHLFEQTYGAIADPGGEFATGCVRRAGIPSARLIEAELLPDRVFVRYEHGGLAGVRSTRAEYRRSGDDWIEVDTQAITLGRTPALPPVRWTGRQHTFSSAIDTVLPPLWTPGSDAVRQYR